MESRRGSWRIKNDRTKNTLRISSHESDQSDDEKLPLDIEIFQNLIDNICRKFDLTNGENLLCFGGCAIFNKDGTLKRVESFLPKYPSLLKSWLKINHNLVQGFLSSKNETLSMSDSDIKRSVSSAESDKGDKFKAIPVNQAVPSDSESNFLVTKVIQHSFESKPSPTSFSSLEDPYDDTVKHSSPKKQKNLRYKVKSGVPVPPRPVLSLCQEEIKEYFPSLVEKLSGKKFPPQAIPKKCSEWDEDVEKVLALKDFSDLGPKVEFNWNKVSPNFFWKLKLVGAILLDKKGVDYTTFAEKVEDKHEKYAIDDLKLMSMSKNPETFEKLFMKKGIPTKSDTPSYINDFEKKSSEIILQNFRLINARDKKLNGNAAPKSRKSSSYKALKTSENKQSPESTKKTVGETASSSETDKASTINMFMNGIKVTPLIDAEDTSILLCEDLEPTKSKRKRSSDFSKEEKTVKKEPANQSRFLCKNTFQKGDFLIHPSQLTGKFGPVKLVTFRRETKKVFLCVSDFETVESSENDFVIMEKCSNKSRSTPAKFLDSYLKINDLIEITEKTSDKMKIRRSIPPNDSTTTMKIETSSTSSPEMKEEMIDLDDLVNDEAFEEELDEADDNEMVIDESRL